MDSDSKLPETASVTLPGVVEKVIKSPDPRLPELAQIAVEGTDGLYKEIRIENALKDEEGETVASQQART
jgi:hypothetical protein